MRCDTDVAAHAHADDGQFRHFRVARDAGRAQRFAVRFQHGQRARVFAARDGEGEVRFTVDRLILYDHVDFDVRVRHRSQDMVCHAWTVGHAEHGDFGFIAVEGDAGDDCLFHVCIFLKRNQGA
ncbi:hypothetical protein D3C72_1733260 [compost metagenome]